MTKQNLLVILLAFLVFSCSSVTNSVFIEAPSYYDKTFNHENQTELPSLENLQGHKLVFMPPYSSVEEIAKEKISEYQSYVSNLSDLGADFFTTDKLDLAQNQLDTFLASFSLTKIADRKFIQSMSEQADFDEMLFLELIYYPCANCKNKNLFGATLSLVDPKTSFVRWYAYNEEIVTPESETERVMIMDKLVNDLFEEFNANFKSIPRISYYNRLKSLG